VGNFNWFRFAESPSLPPPPTTPYGGVAASLPGRVQVENFDEGGQSRAYYDTTGGNSGNTTYRTTDVDIGTTADPDNGGFYVGWTRVDEWLKYTVNVTQGGTYTLNVRVANAGSGARFRVVVDTTDVTGAIDVPNTAGWDRWQTVSVPGVVLLQGSRQITLQMVAHNTENSGVGNYGYLEFR
jgi:hypothetical protein